VHLANFVRQLGQEFQEIVDNAALVKAAGIPIGGAQ